jgi:hypothetical protein
MAGIGDVLFNLFQPDPEQALGQWSDAQQAQNRGAIGLDVNGNPLPPPSAPSAGMQGQGGGQVYGGDHGAAQAQAASTLPPGQEPNATKSPVSLGHLLMNLQQRNEADQGLNQSLGMGFAAFAQPRDRQMVSKRFNVDQPNVNQIGATQMNLAGQQQGQDRMNALGAMVHDPVQGKAIADSLNISQADLIARYQADPQGVGNMIQNFRQPTDALKNLQQIQSLQGTLKAGGANDSEIGLLTPSLIAQVGPEFAQKAIGDAVSYRSSHYGQQAPWVGPGGVNVQKYNQWVADQQELSGSVAKAASAHADAVPTLVSMQNRIDSVKNNPALDSLMSSQAKKDQAQLLLNSDPNAPWAVVIKTIPAGQLALNSQEMQLVSQIRQLNGQEYAEALNTLHQTRPAASEITAMKTGIGQTQSISELDADSYRKQALDPLSEGVKTTIGNSYGASQLLKNMPAEYRTFVNPEFLSGGARALENNGSEGWAASTQITPEELQTAKQWQLPVARGGKGLTHAQAVDKVREMSPRRRNRRSPQIRVRQAPID